MVGGAMMAHETQDRSFWFVWHTEYPDEGSALVEAEDEASARERSGMGACLQGGDDGLTARPVTSDDLSALVERACAEYSESLRAQARISPATMLPALCAALAIVSP